MKRNKSLLGMLMVALIVTLACVTAIGCPKTLEWLDKPDQAGEYASVNDDRIFLFSGYDLRFTLSVTGQEIKAGVWEFSGTTLKLVFDKNEDTDVTATLESEVITMNYGGATITFRRQVLRTVTFDSRGGGPVNPVSVMNGRAIPVNLTPAEPTRDGFEFIGWYSDPACTPASLFTFGKDVVTEPITLYAYWAEPVVGRADYDMDFDWGFDGGHDNPASIRTIGGKLYTQPAEIKRDGYTFRGWWVSMPGAKDKLTYPVVLGTTVFDEKTTLYAFWQENTTGLQAPVVMVSPTGAITWPTVAGAISSYRVNITAPDGTRVVTDGSAPVSQNPSYPFTYSQIGDYIIQVETVGMQQNYSAPTIRHYRHMALARVSIFAVVNSSVLIFDGVKNATRYTITVDCGNKLHRHTDVELGTSNKYDFSNCDMQPGGIKFTVKAFGNGWMASEGIYILDRSLSAVSEIRVDGELNAFWASVPNAEKYLVSVRMAGEVLTDNLDIGNRTSFSLKGYDAGSLQVSVRPASAGYNSPAAVWVAHNKTNLAAPGNIRTQGNTILWDEVAGATSYTIQIGGLEITTASEDGNEYELTAEDLEQLAALGTGDYELKIKSNGASPSLFSDSVLVRSSFPDTISYAAGVAYWDSVLGAQRYVIVVNPGAAAVTYNVSDGASSVRIALTQAGINTITLMAYDSANLPMSHVTADVEVFAYTVTFDARGGSLQTTKLHKAFGDPVDDLPNATTKMAGHNFDAWYTSPGGPAQNAGKYSAATFVGGDLILYANWIAHIYRIELDSGNGTVANGSPDVTYNNLEVFEVPAINGNGFVGWYTRPNGQGTRVTDERGIMFSAWSFVHIDNNGLPVETADGRVLYAFYANIFDFLAAGDNAYTVNRGADINLVKHIVIPDTYDGSNVTSIGMLSHFGLESVTFGKNIAGYEEIAFDGCRNLLNIYVHADNATYKDINGVLYSKDGSRLEAYPTGRTGRVLIPVSVTTISGMAFRNNTNLVYITVPGTVKTIEPDAFFNCNNLVDLILEKGIDRIEDSAFNGCSKLTEITFPADLTHLGSYVFENCTALLKVTFAGGSVKPLIMDEYVFSGSYRLRDIIFEPGSMVENIGDHAFDGNNGLREITIPASVRRIGSYAFRAAVRLEKVFIEDNSQLEKNDDPITGYDAIGTGVFEDAIFLREVIFLGSTNIEVLLENIFTGNASIERITLPSGLVSVAARAFENCAGLKFLTFQAGSQFTTIGAGALRGCVNLTEITLPGSITNFATAMLESCTKLEKITVTAETNANISAAGNVLYNADKSKILLYPRALAATTFEIIDSVTSHDELAFANVPNLAAFTVAAANTVYTVSDGVLFAQEGTLLIRYPSAKAGTTYEVPASVIIIKEYAFRGVKNLTELTFAGELLTEICDYAFDGMTNLAAFNIPAGLKIGKGAFNGCVNLSQITLSEDTTEIGDFMFSGVTGLTTMIIPKNVTYIGDSAFFGTRLTSVTFEAESKLEIIGPNAFRGLTSLGNVTFPEGLKVIGDYAFQGCTAFTAIVIPGSVTYLGDYAFQASGATSNANSNFTVTFKAVIEPEEPEESEDGEEPAEAEGLTMGTHVFANIVRLLSVTFEPDSNVQAIGDYAFYRCINYNNAASLFRTITIPNTVKSIGHYAFAYTGKYYQGTTTNTNTYTEANSGLGTLTFAAGSTLKDIGDYAFQYTNIATVSFPNSVETIGDGAFRGLREYGQWGWEESPGRITSITFNTASYTEEDENGEDVVMYRGVKSIGAGAFYMCRLTTLVLPESLERLGDQAFYQANNVRNNGVYFEGNNYSFVIPNSLKYIGRQALGQVFGSSVRLYLNEGSQLEYVGDEAFTANDNLTGAQTFYLPDTLTHIGESAFSSLTGMTGTVSINTRPIQFVGIMGTWSFYGPFSGAGFRSVVIRAGSEEIQPYLFNDNNFQNITIPGTVGRIGEEAFKPVSWGGTGIQTLTFSERSILTASGIGDSAFHAYGERGPRTIVNMPASISNRDVTSLFGRWVERYEITDPDSPYVSIGGVLFDVNGTTLVMAPPGYGGMRADNNTTLNPYTVPTGVKAIGPNAFYNCGYRGQDTNYTNRRWGITSITIPDSIEIIGESAFQGCIYITAINFNQTTSKLTYLGGYAFSGCTALASFTIPNSLKNIPASAFSNCTALANIYLDSSRTDYKVDGIFLINTLTNAIIVVLGNTATITIPESMTSIPSGFFASRTSIQTVNIHANVTSIGDRAFYGCTGLRTVNFTGTEANPSALSQLVSIGNSAFDGCNNTNFTAISIPASVESIGYRAFGSCTRLVATFAAGSQLAFIGDEAFIETRFAINDFRPLSRLTGIGSSAFVLTQISGNVFYPASLQTIGNYAFQSQSSITSITFEDGSRMKTIGMQAFSDVNLTSINFGLNSMLDTIGMQAFGAQGSTNLTTVTLPDNLKTIGLGAFEGNRSLSRFIVSDSAIHLAVDDGVLFNKAKNTLLIYPNGKGATYAIPDFCTIIDTGAFLCGYQGSLRTLTLHNRVTTINTGAFQYPSITVNLPLSLNRVASRAFQFVGGGTINVQGRGQNDLVGWAEDWIDQWEMDYVRWNTAVNYDVIVEYSVASGNGTLRANLTSATGTLIPSDAMISVASGANIVFTAVPAEGWRVKEWKLNGTTVAGNLTETYTYSNIRASALLSVTVEFEPRPTDSVTYSVINEDFGGLRANITTANGTLVQSGGVAWHGYTIVFTAEPVTGWRVKTWTLNGVVVTGSSVTGTDRVTYTHSNFAGPIEVTVEFEKTPEYTVTFSVVGATGGTLAARIGTSTGTVITTGASVLESRTVYFAATPSTGYMIKEWRLNGAVVNGTTATYTTPALTGDITVTIEYQRGVTVTAATATNGVQRRTYDTAAGTTFTSGTMIAPGRVIYIGTNAPSATATTSYRYTLSAVTGVSGSLVLIHGENVHGGITFLVEMQASATAASNWMKLTIPDVAGLTAFTITAALVSNAVNYSVTGGNGTLAAASGTNTTTFGTNRASGVAIPFNNSYRLTATPSAGYKVKAWYLNGVQIGVGAGATIPKFSGGLPGDTTYIRNVSTWVGAMNFTVEFEPI
ncbi:MAG: leucine-rich repeat protein [Firmicutes bacterium]|nr:leucine-rich repeat protein [Bacillota bacterium]